MTEQEPTLNLTTGTAAPAGTTTTVAWNGSASSRAALLWAIERERSAPGLLLLLTVLDEAYRGFGAAALNELAVAARQALQAEIDWIRATEPSLPVTSLLLEGNPDDMILAHCVPGSMLVLGRREGRSPLQRWSRAARLASRAPVPVSVVPTAEASTPGDIPGEVLQRSGVIVGVDGSPASRQACLTAAAEAHRRQETLDIVYAGPVADPVGTDDAALPRAIVNDCAQEALFAHPALTVRRRFVPGPAAPVLLRLAQDKALLVIGSRGRGAVAGFLLGSVSRALVANATGPLIVVTEMPSVPDPARDPAPDSD
ncbi:universal stress protein [Cryobacterium cryoconiti]|uniref:universal stress protein n=1 Tax=Cryobacterium cryoconiti TaxID=1259239 RepID=UPI00141B415A|nr:universal stress protein [Cryobacterium cryoconiti]